MRQTSGFDLSLQSGSKVYVLIRQAVGGLIIAKRKLMDKMSLQAPMQASKIRKRRKYGLKMVYLC